MRRKRPIRAVAAVAVMAAVLAAGCNGGESAQPEPSGLAGPTQEETTPGTGPQPPVGGNTPSPNTQPQPPAAPEATCQLPGASTREAFIRADDDGYLQMSRLVGQAPRVGAHNTGGDCFERVVFPFEGELQGSDRGPGVHVRYVDEPIGDGSGLPLDIPGEAYLRFTAGAWTYGEQGGTGPRQLTDRQLRTVESIQQVALGGNFEGTTTWYISLPEQRDFRLSQVSGTPNCPDICAVVDIETN